MVVRAGRGCPSICPWSGAEEKTGAASAQQHSFLQGATILKGLGSGEHAEEGRPKMSAGTASRYNYKISRRRVMPCMRSTSFTCTVWPSPPLLSTTYATVSWRAAVAPYPVQHSRHPLTQCGIQCVLSQLHIHLWLRAISGNTEWIFIHPVPSPGLWLRPG